MKKFINHKQTAKSGKKGTASALHHFGADVGNADSFYPVAVYKTALDLQAKGLKRLANTAASAAAAADGENANPNQAAQQSTSTSANADEKTRTSGS